MRKNSKVKQGERGFQFASFLRPTHLKLKLNLNNENKIKDNKCVCVCVFFLLYLLFDNV